jgi:signal transduction histidine kinase
MRWIWDRGFPVKDQAGRVYRLAGIAEDITERKQAEAQLKATSAQLRALMASLQSAREQEGVRIAREIHDELGSALTSRIRSASENQNHAAA